MCCHSGTANHEVRYVIVGGDPLGNFTLDETGGSLRPTAPIDFEAILNKDKLFNLTIKVSHLTSLLVELFNLTLLVTQH